MISSIHSIMMSFEEMTNFECLQKQVFNYGFVNFKSILKNFSKIPDKGNFSYSALYYKIDKANLSREIKEFSDKFSNNGYVKINEYYLKCVKDSHRFHFQMSVDVNLQPDKNLAYTFNVSILDTDFPDYKVVHFICYNQQDIDELVKPFVEIFFRNAMKLDKRNNKEVTLALSSMISNLTDKNKDLRKEIKDNKEEITKIRDFKNLYLSQLKEEAKEKLSDE